METPSTDAQLVAAAISGSLSAYETLVLRHQSKLYLQALRYTQVREDAQDALQDAFLKAFRQLSALQDHSRFSAWVGRILRNTCLNRLRAARYRDRLANTEGGSVAEVAPDHPVYRNAALEGLLSILPEESSEMFSLHYLDGYSIAEVASRLGATPAAVKQRLYRARQQLQEEVTLMAKDKRKKDDLPEGFAAQTIVRLIEEGRTDRLYLRTEEARARFREALDVSPDNPEALIELCRTYDPMKGPSQEERATIERAVAVAPDSVQAAREFTVACTGDKEKQRKAIEDCINLCDRRINQEPDDVEALVAKAQMLLWKGQFEEMEQAARLAVDAASEDQQAVYYLALSLSRQDRREEAFSLYERVYELDCKTVWAYFALRQMGTYLGFHRGDWNGAVEMQEQVWELTEKPEEGGNLIYFYGQAGKADEAKDLFEKVKYHRHPQRVYDVLVEA